jgi:hypothetical protein
MRFVIRGQLFAQEHTFFERWLQAEKIAFALPLWPAYLSPEKWAQARVICPG